MVGEAPATSPVPLMVFFIVNANTRTQATLSFSSEPDGSTLWTASTFAGGLPEGPVQFSIEDYWDLAGNHGPAVTTVMDGSSVTIGTCDV